MIVVSDTSPISNLIQIERLGLLSEAIALCKEQSANLLLIDERLGTKIAKARGLNTIGLIGCLITAKKKSIIKEIRPIVEELETKAGFYVGETFKESIYKIAGE
ncbi:MAG: DUF3368 domain-containing protein [Tunicatimonas sp.]